MNGLAVSFLVGAIVALGGILIVLVYLPSSAPSASANADARGSDWEARSEPPKVPPFTGHSPDYSLLLRLLQLLQHNERSADPCDDDACASRCANATLEAHDCGGT
jgi:hypothetical protein